MLGHVLLAQALPNLDELGPNLMLANDHTLFHQVYTRVSAQKGKGGSILRRSSQGYGAGKTGSQYSGEINPSLGSAVLERGGELIDVYR